VIGHASGLAQTVLALVDVAVAVIGITAAFSIWGSGPDQPRYESSFLENVWYWDDFYDATIGRPLTTASQFGDDVIETQHHRRRGQRNGRERAPQRRRPAKSPVGLRAASTHWPRCSGLAVIVGLSRCEGGLVHSSVVVNPAIVVPLVGAGGLDVHAQDRGSGVRRRGRRGQCRDGTHFGHRGALQQSIAGAQTFDFATRHVLSAPFGLAYDVALDGISAVHGGCLCALVL